LLGVPAGFLCWAPHNVEYGELKRRKFIRIFNYDQPWRHTWVPRTFLLHVHRVGEGYRGDGGWFVAIQGRLLRGEPNAFLQHPWEDGDDRLGPIPWRFGSRGEAIYYLSCLPFRAHAKVSVCQMVDSVYTMASRTRAELSERFPVLLPQVQIDLEEEAKISSRELLRRGRLRTSRLYFPNKKK